MIVDMTLLFLFKWPLKQNTMKWTKPWGWISGRDENNKNKVFLRNLPPWCKCKKSTLYPCSSTDRTVPTRGRFLLPVIIDLYHLVWNTFISAWESMCFGKAHSSHLFCVTGVWPVFVTFDWGMEIWSKLVQWECHCGFKDIGACSACK